MASSASAASSSKPRPDDRFEPDAKWKADLKKRIEENLKGMVQDAKDLLEDGLRKAPAHRDRLHTDFNNSMDNIRKLADDTYRDELERERQERRWAMGADLNPAWKESIEKEQQAILDMIKSGKGSAPPETQTVDASDADAVSEPQQPSPVPDDHTSESPPSPNVSESPTGEQESTDVFGLDSESPTQPPLQRQSIRAGKQKEHDTPRFSSESPPTRSGERYSRPIQDRSPLTAFPKPSPERDTSSSGRSFDRSNRNSLELPLPKSSPGPTIPYWHPPKSDDSPSQSNLQRRTSNSSRSEDQSSPYGLQRRGSTASQRSIGSTGFRPSSATIPIPETDPSVASKAEQEKRALHEVDQQWSRLESAREKSKDRVGSGSYEHTTYDYSNHSPGPGSVSSSPSQSRRPPTPPMGTKPVYRKPSFMQENTRGVDRRPSIPTLAGGPSLISASRPPDSYGMGMPSQFDNARQGTPITINPYGISNTMAYATDSPASYYPPYVPPPTSYKADSPAREPDRYFTSTPSSPPSHYPIQSTGPMYIPRAPSNDEEDFNARYYHPPSSYRGQGWAGPGPDSQQAWRSWTQPQPLGPRYSNSDLRSGQPIRPSAYHSHRDHDPGFDDLDDFEEEDLGQEYGPQSESHWNMLESRKREEKKKRQAAEEQAEETKRKQREHARRKEQEEQEKKERAEKERLEKERLEKERLRREKLEQERLEKERREKERLEKELEMERLEKERLKIERLEKERLEKERLRNEKLERERREKEERERLEALEREREEERERLRIEEERKKKEEEARRKAEDLRRREEELERKKQEAAQRKREAELRKKEEEIKRKEEEFARIQEEEMKLLREENQKKEEELKRQAQEAKKKEQEAKRREKEARKKEQEAKKKEEEISQREAELSAREEELKRRESQAEEERRRLKEEEEMRMRKEAEMKRVREQEERKRTKEAKEAEKRRQREEEKRRKREEEERQQKEEEERRQREEEERRQREEEERRQREEEERLQREEEERRKREEQERQLKEEEERRLKMEEEERRRKEEEERRRREEEELRQRAKRLEDERKSEELARKMWEEEQRRAQVDDEWSMREEAKKRLEAREAAARAIRERQEAEALRQQERMEAQWKKMQDERKREEETRKQEDRRREEEARKNQQDSSKSSEFGWANWSSASSAATWQTQRPSNGTSTPNRSASNSASSAWSASSKSSSASSAASARTSASSTASGATSNTSETSSSSTPTPKARSGSTGASGAPFSEAEWQRRQEEFSRQQQERFIQEQDRLERERLNRAAKVMTKEDVVVMFDNHERLWQRMSTLDQLRWDHFPWPMFKKPASPEEITFTAISAYILSPHYPEKDKSRPEKDRIKEHIRRWHPDRFETKMLPKVIDVDKEKVREGAGFVVRSLNDLLTKSNTRLF